MNFKRVLATSALASSANGRTPGAVFVSSKGVYELDVGSRKSIRVWPRTTKGTELASFSGKDAAGNGAQWSNPVVLAKHPTENLVAVVDTASQDPAVYFYSFEETVSAGVLKSTAFTFVSKFADPTGGMLQWAAGASFYADGRLAVAMNSSSSGAESTQVVVIAADHASVDSFFFTDLKQASGIAVDTTTESLYLAFGNTNAVVRYVAEAVEAAAGETVSHDLVLGKINVPGESNALLGAPQSIAVVHPSDCSPATIVVADTYNHRVVGFDALGRVRFSFGVKGSSAAGELLNPRSFYLFDEDGTAGTKATLAIADTGNRRLQVFSCDTTDLEEVDNSIKFEPEALTYDESDEIAGNFQVYLIAQSFDRSYTIDVTSMPAGAAAVGVDAASLAVTPASITVDVPANADHGSFVFTPLNGVAADTDVKFTFSYAGTEVASTNLVIKNVAPVIESTNYSVNHVVNGNSLAPVFGSTVNLTLVATDVAADVAGGLTYSWTLPTSGNYTGSATEEGVDLTDVSFTADLAGTQVAMCKVTDPDGASVSYRWTFSVSDPVTYGTVTPDPINESDDTEYSFSFTVEPSDIDRDYTLICGGYLVMQTGCVEAGTSTCTIAAGETEGTVTFKVVNAVDPSNNGISLYVLSSDGTWPDYYPTIAYNVAPEITDDGLGASVVDGGTAYAGDTITVDATGLVQDVAADLANMTYVWTLNGSRFGTEAAASVTLDADAVGDYTIRLTVTDPEGATATKEITFTVNDLPEEAQIVWAGTAAEPVYESDKTAVSLYFDVLPYTARRTYTVALTGELVDAGLAKLSSSKAVVAANATQGRVRVLIANAGESTGVDATLTITVTSVDYGSSCSGTITATNADPVILSAGANALDGATLLFGKDWFADAEIKDVAADLAGMAYEWTFDGAEISTTQDAYMAAPAIGDHTVTLKVTDPDGGEATTTLTFTVEDEGPAYTAASAAITGYDFNTFTATGAVTMTSGNIEDVPFAVEKSTDLKTWKTYLMVGRSIWVNGTATIGGETVTADPATGEVTFTFGNLAAEGAYMRLVIANPE